jgi:YidC/Oxa1 family membrane protein insertase
MKLQDLFVPVCFAFITMWALNYFFPGKHEVAEQEVRSGQKFSTQVTSQMCQPVALDVNFYATKTVEANQSLDVHGYKSQYIFSTDAGSIKQLSYERDLGGKPGLLTTVSAACDNDRTDLPFLVALDEMTPFYFEQKQSDDSNTVLYEGVTPHARVIKKYTVSPHSYRIDLELTVEPLVADKMIQPRLFFPGPYMSEIAESEKVSAIVFNARNSVEKVVPAQTINSVWASPKIFGAESKYFLNALVSDANNFTQRAYFKVRDIARLTTILEGPRINQKTTWNLSFYCGPKESDALAAVDKRLESVMDYGWLAFISRFMIWLLNWIYAYVGNYGWAIVILTLLMRLLMVPFTKSNARSRHKQKEYQKKMKYLEQQYKHDPEALAQAKLELIKKMGLFAGMGSGCLPLLLQFPLFIGLNYALRSSIELYQAPFILWIHDLSAKDPYYILPTFLGISAFFMLSSTAKDPRHKVAMAVMALLIGGVSANLSAGLSLYICLSSFLGYAQNELTNRIKTI